MTVPPPAADRRPVLITGAHRSATGWVGKVLVEAAPPLGWVWEPWNPQHRRGTFPPRFPRFYQSVVATDPWAAHVRDAFADLLRFRYRPLVELRTVRAPRDLARLARDWSRARRNRREHRVPLVKDPIALFAAEWLADEFDLRVVLTVRHPAAFVASLRHRGWRHDFRSFVDQPGLLTGRLAPFADEIHHHAAAERDHVDEGVLLWRILYTEVARLADAHPDWVVVVQERLAEDPVAGFRDLFERLGLAFGPRAEALVRASSSAANPTLEEHGGSVHRNSAAHRWNWARQLSADEVARVRAATGELAARWYGPDDWAPPTAAAPNTTTTTKEVIA